MIKFFLKKTVIYKFIINYRAGSARRFLKSANMYPEKMDMIVKDYAFSIKRDHRDFMQVINLEEVIDYVAEKAVPGAFVETGVFTGGASAFGLLSLKRHMLFERDYWGFDSFEGMPKPTQDDGQFAKRWLDTSDDSGALSGCAVNLSDYEETKRYLLTTGFPSDKINLVKGWFQNTIPASKSKIGKILILRLDGDFYESTRVVLEQLYDQVSPGGVVIVDDYGSFEGCRKAVDEFFVERGLRHIFLHYVDRGVRFFVKA